MEYFQIFILKLREKHFLNYLLGEFPAAAVCHEDMLVVGYRKWTRKSIENLNICFLHGSHFFPDNDNTLHKRPPMKPSVHRAGVPVCNLFQRPYIESASSILAVLNQQCRVVIPSLRYDRLEKFFPHRTRRRYY